MDDGEDEVPNAMDDNEDEVPNAMDDSEDEVPNAMDESEDEDPNENNGIIDEVPIDSEDENDGLSDVNEDNIVEEEVIDYPVMGTLFILRDDGRITIEVGQLLINSTHFREVLLDYYIQEGFKLRRIKNEKRRITYGCEANGCHWRAHGSPTFDRVTYMLKTLRNAHNCLAVPKNKDVTLVWLGKRFELLIKENPNINIRVLSSVILRQCGFNVPDHTLYRAKKYALNIESEDHKNSYNKLYSSSTTGAARNATTTGAAGNGIATTAASPRIPGIVTRHEGTSTQPPTPPTQGAPQPSQHSQP
ncbi:hypothetical protein LWI28_021573 [Acer negundo]|uniref:Transposase MuDR plant domain-containing protein n=1 Tax=Acer negundo TaxID=4023 RepID=A0AAD5P4S1_ACENE|nr:hypothetical protein LWI28_021573 [Acer negundo]